MATGKTSDAAAAAVGLFGILGETVTLDKLRLIPLAAGLRVGRPRGRASHFGSAAAKPFLLNSGLKCFRLKRFGPSPIRTWGEFFL